MARNSTSVDFSLILSDKNLNQDMFETTYKSAYGNFYPENSRHNCSNLKFHNNYATNKLTNINHNTKNNYSYIYKAKLMKEKNKLEKNIANNNNNRLNKPKLMCPYCINENIIKSKSINRIRRKNYETEYFEDKTKYIHEYKRKEDIKNRENRAKKTYISLYKNRNRSAQPFNNIVNINNKTQKEYFGDDIEYGMLRCRNRELKNNNKLFDIDLNNFNKNYCKINDNNNIIINNDLNNKKCLKTNKSWLGPKNYLLDKKEYNLIINKQMEKDYLRNKKERNDKLREENILLKEQLNKEKNDINREINYKQIKRNEMNKININILKCKELQENKEKKLKKIEKDKINYICKKQIEDFVKRVRQKKMLYKNVEDENMKMAESKRLDYKKEKNKIEKNYQGLNFRERDNTNCESCNRIFPKNVMSYMFYTFNAQQNKNKNENKM